jgi:hypothetical protein
VYSVDGVQVVSHAMSIAGTMRPIVRDVTLNVSR